MILTVSRGWEEKKNYVTDFLHYFLRSYIYFHLDLCEKHLLDMILTSALLETDLLVVSTVH